MFNKSENTSKSFNILPSNSVSSSRSKLFLILSILTVCITVHFERDFFKYGAGFVAVINNWPCITTLSYSPFAFVYSTDCCINKFFTSNANVSS